MSKIKRIGAGARKSRPSFTANGLHGRPVAAGRRAARSSSRPGILGLIDAISPRPAATKEDSLRDDLSFDIATFAG